MVKAGKPYGNMIIRMDMDTAQFTQSLTAIRRGSRNLRDEMKAVNNVFRGSGNEAKRLSEEYKVLARQMDQQEKEYKSLANRKRELEAQNKKETVQYSNIVQQMNRVTGSMARYENQIKQNRDANARFNAEGNKLREGMKHTNILAKSQIALFSKSGNAMKATRVEQERLRNAIKSTNSIRQSEIAQLSKIKAQFGANSNEVKEHIAKINSLKSAQNGLQSELKETASKMDYLGQRQKVLNTGLGRQAQVLKNQRSNLAELRNGLMSVGAGMTAVSYPLYRALGGAVKATVEWEDALANVAKTTNASESEMKGFSTTIRDMAKEMPESQADIANTMAMAAQLGIKNLKGFTRVATQMSVATDMTAEDAATSMARFANATGKPDSNFNKLGSTVVQLGKYYCPPSKQLVG